MTLLKRAQALQAQCMQDRRYLHAHAECGFELRRTQEYVLRRLREMGIDARENGRCGAAACIGRPGKTILLRADMDALPIREVSGLDFASNNGCMHACGHDMHTAMLLSAAQMLKERENELGGTVKLLFQPAEELLLGAQDAINHGILEDPAVDAAVMLHVVTGQRIPVGTLIPAPPGESAPAAGFFTIEVQGKGGHGAMPGESADPINAAAHITLALQAIHARELGLNNAAMLTIGMMQAGSAANVIPDTAILRGSYRSYGDCAFIRRRIEEIAVATARAFQTEARFCMDGECPTLLNNAEMCALAEESLQAAGLEMIRSEAFASRSSGSEDFAVISHRVPSVMLALAAGHMDDGHMHPLHHPAVTFDERALPFGSAAHAAIAIRFLQA